MSSSGERIRIEQSESVATLAARHGFQSWKTLWLHAENQALRERRPNPHTLAPGDEVFVPKRESRNEAKASEGKHRFRLNSGVWVMRLELRDERLDPIEGEPYILKIPNLEPIAGETGSDGLIEHPLPRDTRDGTLTVMGEEMTLRFHELDPISKVSGVQARLTNLGFSSGPADGIVGPLTRAAVSAFQASRKDLTLTGEIDDAMRRTLLELHDNDSALVAAEESMDAWGGELPIPQREAEKPGAPAPELDLDQRDTLLPHTPWEDGPDSDGHCSVDDENESPVK